VSRDLSVAVAAALAAQVLRPALFFEGTFASGVLRLWTGLGDVEWNGVTWSGAGSLLGFGSIEETGSVVASGTVVSLSGVPADLVQMCIADAQQGLPGRVWLGLLTEAMAVIADPVLAFSGRLDVPEITDGQDACVITISYESRLIDLNTPRSWRYTHESQKAIWPDDKGFEFVTAIQEQEIKWGRG